NLAAGGLSSSDSDHKLTAEQGDILPAGGSHVAPSLPATPSTPATDMPAPAMAAMAPTIVVDPRWASDLYAALRAYVARPTHRPGHVSAHHATRVAHVQALSGNKLPIHTHLVDVALEQLSLRSRRLGHGRSS